MLGKVCLCCLSVQLRQNQLCDAHSARRIRGLQSHHSRRRHCLDQGCVLSFFHSLSLSLSHVLVVYLSFVLLSFSLSLSLYLTFTCVGFLLFVHSLVFLSFSLSQVLVVFSSFILVFLALSHFHNILFLMCFSLCSRTRRTGLFAQSIPRTGSLAWRPARAWTPTATRCSLSPRTPSSPMSRSPTKETCKTFLKHRYVY
jgi:hypothetical protein